MSTSTTQDPTEAPMSTSITPDPTPAPQPTTTPARARLGRPFGIHLTGVSLANLADGIILGGLPLVAVTLTRSPGEISLLQVAFWLPWLLLGVAAGVVVDRLDRRHVQLAGAAARVLLLGGMTGLAATDRLTMPLLIAAVGVYGITQVFVDLAASSIIPQVAPRSRLSAANGRIMGAETVFNNFVGGPVGGLLFVLGAGWVFGIPVALGIAFLLLIGLGLRGSYRAERTPEPVGRQRQELLEGFRFQITHPVLRPLLLTGSTLNFANTAYFAVFVLWVVGPESRVGLSPEQFPLLLAVLAVGAVAGALVAERLSARVGEVPLLIGGWFVNSALLIVPVLAPEAWSIAAAFLVIGFTNMCGNVVGRTMRQRLVPADKLGKVGGAGGMIGYGLMPLGALLGGVVAEVWDLPAVFVGAVVLNLLAVTYAATRVSTRLLHEHETV
ncbi:MFS transporter [Ornithinimicrobium sp. F0845]|uniref:MFS transporter n=1 Tax=Ornithinimicrobium sp. F0845 TaxID=2926412 RepID=UPI001FF65F99|nr:MFS transporter [Ornithinimicrobium sp. F0845]MCK0112452.1 MFS transporter [Ornithinimicrobium sp. F0845]